MLMSKDLEISGVGKPENEVDCRNDKNRWVQEKEHTNMDKYYTIRIVHRKSTLCQLQLTVQGKKSFLTGPPS
jgi:hypothetical protein